MSKPLPNPNKDSTPFDSGYLNVSELHSLYYEQHGNQQGKPVVFLHGGPGGQATVNSNLIFFDLTIFRVVLFDQRGAGKSLPLAELRDNTSHDLVRDIETLRTHLSIRKWHTVFGGSWGSTLALLYAQTHPEATSSLVLRGIYLVTQEELDWFFGPETTPGHGIGSLFPDIKSRWLQHLTDAGEDASSPLTAYYRLLTHADPATVRAAAREWSRAELSTVALHPDLDELAKELADDEFLLRFARIEASYFVNRAWLRDGQLLEAQGIERIKSIPTAIVQGRYDVVCPAKYAWRLYQALGGEGGSCELHFTIAGHAATEPETAAKLIEICKRFGKREF